MNTAEPTVSWKKAAHVIVDWSQELPKADTDLQLEVDHLMNWVKSYPERTAVQVYLRRSLSNSRDRMLQNTLQSLGCTVTMRSRQTVVS
jgi:hypothetical protein